MQLRMHMDLHTNKNSRSLFLFHQVKSRQKNLNNKQIGLKKVTFFSWIFSLVFSLLPLA